MNIYVGNLPYRASENELKDFFAQYGEVTSVKIITDRETNRSKGFGFVEMANDIDLNAINGTEFQGRNLRVDLAKPRNY